MAIDIPTELYNLEPGSVFKFPDNLIIMDRVDDKGVKEARACIVMSAPALINSKVNMINVIPLSTQGQADRYCYPINQKYQDCTEDFVPSENSLAILPYYQPLKRNTLVCYCGKLEIDVINGIRATLAKEIIGYEDYDLD